MTGRRRVLQRPRAPNNPQLEAALLYTANGILDISPARARGSQIMGNICNDCGTDTTPCTDKPDCRHEGRWESYVVHNSVWAAAGQSKGFLCIGCLEKRLGRKLKPRDFTDIPANHSSSWDTERLAARKSGARKVSPPSDFAVLQRS
jgi:hypothetical protein